LTAREVRKANVPLNMPRLGEVAPPEVLALSIPLPALIVWLRHVG